MQITHHYKFCISFIAKKYMVNIKILFPTDKQHKKKYPTTLQKLKIHPIVHKEEFRNVSIV